CMGHDYLKQFGKYEHMWGIGRHVLGSQVYDYWADPWGHVHEHWADSDRLNLANGSNLVPAEEALVSQWGEAPPEKFINHASPCGGYRVTRSAATGCCWLESCHPRVQERGPAAANFLDATRQCGGHIGRIAHLLAIGAKRFGDLGELHIGRKLCLETVG